jgi:3beta-hydroxy-delta5-steroid dehydrogenase/steroid delta-isomerase
MSDHAAVETIVEAAVESAEAPVIVERDAARMRSCLVTGGSGFLGTRLVQALLERGLRVRVLDLQPPAIEHAELGFVRGDIREYEQVRSALEGVDTVFHSASVVELVSFYTAETRRRSVEINVGGTENVIRACHETGVRRLVYTSSCNVMFEGREVELLEESQPYPKKHMDLYSETKAMAERAVLEANGQGALLTCAIRPSGIYGPGDGLILKRAIEKGDDGAFAFPPGKASTLTEFSYIDNVVAGHLLAAEKLLPGSPSAGQAYFINDGVYKNSFEYMRPLIEAVGGSCEKFRIPTWPLKIVAGAWELGHRFLKLPRPAFTYVEIFKATVSHPCSIEKARRELGYEPVVSYDEAMERCLPYCRQIVNERERVERPHWLWWVSIILGMLVLGLVAHDPSTWGWWSEKVTAAIPRWIFHVALWAAVLTHVHKGMKAVRLAERAGLHRTSSAWGWQTFVLGFASMSLLLPRIERASRSAAEAS